MSPIQKARIKSLCQSLKDSCQEGYNEDWDTTTDEGRKGFLDMMDALDEIEKILYPTKEHKQ